MSLPLDAEDVQRLIEKHDVPCGTGMCFVASAGLLPHIPGARFRSGALNLPDWTQMVHWWLETDTLRIDPTFGQLNDYRDEDGEPVVDADHPAPGVLELSDGNGVTFGTKAFTYYPDAELSPLPCSTCGWGLGDTNVCVRCTEGEEAAQAAYDDALSAAGWSRASAGASEPPDLASAVCGQCKQPLAQCAADCPQHDLSLSLAPLVVQAAGADCPAIADAAAAP